MLDDGGPRIPGLYMPAHDLLVGDIIVYENRITKIVNIKRHARLYTGSENAVTPIFELRQSNDDAIIEWSPMCIDTMARVHLPVEGGKK